MEAQADLGLMYQFGWGVDIDYPSAEKWYLKAAEQGDSSCMESLAEIYAGQYNGSEKLKNFKKADEWFKKAEKATVDKSEFEYDEYYTFLEDEGREKDAFEVMKRGAKAGHVISILDLAYVYYFGDNYGVSQDFEKAGELFEEAADLGIAEAMMRMGEFCLYAYGNVPEDNDRAVQYLQDALEINDELTFAHLLLGKCYYNGWGTSENLGKAKEHFKKAANNDSAEAMYWLGIVFRDSGNGNEATKWLQKAADNDISDGFLALGYMYLNGNAVKQNYERAYNFFKKADNQGNMQAKYKIGDMYFYGQHVRQNYDEAVRYYRKAAENDIIDAKAMLGLCYLCGNGVSGNYEYGAQLLEEAAEEGSELAEELIESYNEGYDEGYNSAYNGSVSGNNFDKLINNANSFIKSDKGKSILKKAGKGAVMGAAGGLAGGNPISVLGGAIKGAAGAALTAAFDEEE